MAIKKIEVQANTTSEVKDQFFWSVPDQAIKINKVMCVPGNNTINDEDLIGPIVLAIHFGARGYDASFPNPFDDGFRARVARVPDVFFQTAGGTYQAFGPDLWIDVDVTIPVEDLVVGVRNNATISGVIYVDYDSVSLSEVDAAISRYI